MAIELMDKIKPKGGGSFPMVDSCDVEMSDGTRLEEFLEALFSVFNVQVTRALPEPSAVYRGRLIIISGGKSDCLYICLLVDEQYKWIPLYSKGKLPKPEIQLHLVQKLATPAIRLFDDYGTLAVLGKAVLGKAILGNGSSKLKAPVIYWEEPLKLDPPVIELVALKLKAPVIELMEV